MASSPASKTRRAGTRESPRSRPPTRPVKKLYGHERPRIFTPPLRPLEPRTSATEKRTLGYNVIDFATEVLRISLFPWQRWLLVHLLELLPNGALRFRIAVVLVARQNGKSTVGQVLSLWFMYVYGWRLVLGTAQDLDTAEEVWQGAVDLVQELDENDEPVRPELYELLDRVVLVNGKKSLELKTGQRYKVKAANRRAGRGLSGNLVELDELREHQSWDAWGAITKTTMAQDEALILALSNAGDATSIVLRHLRMMAHAALDDPDGICAEAADGAPAIDDDEIDDPGDAAGIDESDLFIAEWSAPPACDINDREAWAYANPSMGHSIAERTIASAARTDPEWVFRPEVLCQWWDSATEGPFPPGAWEKSADPQSAAAEDSRIVACVDVSWDRTTSHVAIAGWRDDGLPHVEVVASRTGTDWVVAWFTDEARPHRRTWPVVVQGKGAPASSLVDALRDAGLTVIEWGGGDLAAACGDVYDRIRAAVGEGATTGRLRHRSQPLLNVAAATAVTRPLGDAWVWDRKKSPTDAAPLVAVTGALWALTTRVEERTASAYEDTDLMIV